MKFQSKGLAKFAAFGGAAVLAGVLAAPPAALASSAPDAGAALFDTSGSWAPAATASIHPGVMTQTEGSGQCTANFVYTAGGKSFLGQAAHCSGTGEATETNGCEAKSLPLGTPVQILGSDVVGHMVYNSWIAMQAAGEKDPNACAYNDLALIELPADALAKVNPSVPVFGGPVGVNTTGTTNGEQVVSYGNSSLRQGISLFSPKTGTSLGTEGNGWTHAVYTVTPGIPGDSGSAFLDSKGYALGDLSTLAFAPVPLSNQVSDLAHELDYARSHDKNLRDVRVVAGTEPFLPGALPLG
ncbi:serine protease [Sporichthya sp.]|uniref:serine protease n=1 Tax=Sporichthya sp. TaxID=65475 RepID=UPI0017AF0E90|nr:serine protease [Sporichthya sp.]MBA3744917.1 serine protease [Sporichthya sp.]